MKKVLIITYYWPPSGGAGVQRWLKLGNYLQESGLQVFVIAPREEDASYFAFDSELEKEIHPDIKVIKTGSFEPVNLYAKLVGKKHVPTAGFSNVKPGNIMQKISLFIRSNLFIPDPRKFWGNYAYKAAVSLIREENISCVITTSPPHSVQLIGRKLQRNTGVKWIADLRDLWTDVYYYPLLQHSFVSRKMDARYERKVLESANALVSVSPNFIQAFLSKSKLLNPERFHFIPNGYDPADFNAFNHQYKPEFILTYTGTVNLQYKILPFFEALKIFEDKYPNSGIKVRFVGFIDDMIRKVIQEKELNCVELISYVSHTRVIKYLQESFGLLLFGPLNSKNEEGGIPAKVFEYMATGRKVIYLGKKDGFVATLLDENKAGVSFEEDIKELLNYLESLHQDYTSGRFDFNISPNLKKYSRKEQALQFVKIIEAL